MEYLAEKSGKFLPQEPHLKSDVAAMGLLADG